MTSHDSTLGSAIRVRIEADVDVRLVIVLEITIAHVVIDIEQHHAVGKHAADAGAAYATSGRRRSAVGAI